MRMSDNCISERMTLMSSLVCPDPHSSQHSVNPMGLGKNCEKYKHYVPSQGQAYMHIVSLESQMSNEELIHSFTHSIIEALINPVSHSFTTILIHAFNQINTHSINRSCNETCTDSPIKAFFPTELPERADQNNLNIYVHYAVLSA